jgi:alanyl-tRNA synthetase
MKEKLSSAEIRSRFLQFFKERGHTIVPSASLVPENDPTTLFTGSGMQPLVPYLLGKDHPSGKRLVDSQKSFRTVDIDDIGDNRHTTFFEMLGNWSLGDYFKKEQISWIFEFLTEEIGLDPHKLYVTVFIGDESKNLPKDTESARIWKDIFAKKGIEAQEVEFGSEEQASKKGMGKAENNGRIFYYYAKNWWSRAGVPESMPSGEPGGPCSEMFYEFSDVLHDEKFGTYCHPNCDCGRYIEIGNSVFMEYKKNDTGDFENLPQRNVDFGGGLERMTTASLYVPDIFKTDFFQPAIALLEKMSSKSYEDTHFTSSFRIILDHIRSSIFLIADGVNPSNTDRGYFVRRLIRRTVRHADILGIRNSLTDLIEPLLVPYGETYPETKEKILLIKKEIEQEESKFRRTMHEGIKEFNKIAADIKNSNAEISGSQAFDLFSSHGLPIDIIVDLAKERGLKVDITTFNEKFAQHKKISSAGAEKKFKGGLADTSETTIKYHTATHLLHQALHDVLDGANGGSEANQNSPSTIEQKGSNITAERLRFDFSFPRKMTDEEKKRVEDIVNENIAAHLPVGHVIMPRVEAEKTGARHFFNEKYGEEISIYYIGADVAHAYSKEFCGGPHVKNTFELAGEDGLARFKIIKEEAVAQGVRRIKAVLG